MGLDLVSLSQCAEPCHGTDLTREPDLGHDSVEFSFGARCDEFHRRSIPFRVVQGGCTGKREMRMRMVVEPRAIVMPWRSSEGMKYTWRREERPPVLDVIASTSAFAEFQGPAIY